MRGAAVAGAIAREVTPTFCLYLDAGECIAVQVIAADMQPPLPGRYVDVAPEGTVLLTRVHLENGYSPEAIIAGYLAAKCCFNNGIPIPDLIQGPVPHGGPICIPPGGHPFHGSGCCSWLWYADEVPLCPE